MNIKYFIISTLTLGFLPSIKPLTQLATIKSVEKQSEVATLLKQNIQTMQPAEYANWQKKIQEAIDYIKQVSPEMITTISNAFNVKKTTYEVAHPNTQALTAPTTTLSNLVTQLEALKIQIDSELKTINPSRELLPEFILPSIDILNINDLYEASTKKRSFNQTETATYHRIEQETQAKLDQAIFSLANQVAIYLGTDKNGFLTALEFSSKVHDTLKKSTITSQLLRDHIEAAIHSNTDNVTHIHTLISQGIIQTDNLFPLTVPHLAEKEQNTFQKSLELIINNQKDQLGILNRIGQNWTESLTIIKDFILTITDPQKMSALKKILTPLTDYFNVLIDCNSLLQKLDQKSVVSSDINTIGTLLNNILQMQINANRPANTEIKSTTESTSIEKESIDDLLLTLEAATGAVKKYVSSFDPEKESVPNFTAIYNTIESTRTEYNQLTHKFTEYEKKQFLDAYNNTIKIVDQQVVILMNNIMKFIASDKGLGPIMNWCNTQLPTYSKKLSELNLEHDKMLPIIIKLTGVIRTLFETGVLFKDQPNILKNIFQRAVAPTNDLAQLSIQMNILFNTTKDTKGTVKGIISKIISSIYDFLELTKKYMVENTELIVQATQKDLQALVPLLDELYSFENTLIVGKIQKYLSLDSPFSDTNLLNEAKKLTNLSLTKNYALKTEQTISSSTIKSQKVFSDPFIEDLIATLMSVQKDIATNQASLTLPKTIPSFDKQHEHILEVEKLYQESKHEFTKEDKTYYKNLVQETLNKIDYAQLSIASTCMNYIIKTQNMLPQQLNYIITLFTALKTGDKKTLDTQNNQAFQEALAQADTIKTIFVHAIEPLKMVDKTILNTQSSQKEVTDFLKTFNILFNKTPDPQSKNSPTGLFDKLIALWQQFFNECEQIMKKSSVESVKTFQQLLHPTLTLLLDMFESIEYAKTITTLFNLKTIEIDDHIIDHMTLILDQQNAQTLAQPTTTNASMQKTQPIAQPIPSNTPTIKKETPVQQKESIAQTAIKNITTTVTTFDNAVKQMPTNNPTNWPDGKTAFEAIIKLYDDYEVDSALHTVSTTDENNVQTAYKKGLQTAGQGILTIVNNGSQQIASLCQTIIKELAKLSDDLAQKKITAAQINTHPGIASLKTNITTIETIVTQTIMQADALRHLPPTITLTNNTAAQESLNKLIDDVIKNKTKHGLLDQLTEAILTIFNDCVAYMKTIDIQQVKTYQQSLLFLKEPCNKMDTIIKNIQSIGSIKLLSIKNNSLIGQLEGVYQQITDQTKATKFAKGSTEGFDVQKALTSLKSDLK